MTVTGVVVCTHCGHSETLHRVHVWESCGGILRRDDLRPDIEGGWWILCNCPGFQHLEYDMPLAPSAQELYEQMRKADP
jgi:Fe2+ or Zn2+ uptake regulation protein